MSKISNKCLDEEISFLRITIEHFATENKIIKQKIEDLKVTYQSDKDLLNEYYNQISNKDLNVRKLTNTIEQLKTRLNHLEITNKKNYFRVNSNGNLNDLNLNDDETINKGLFTERIKPITKIQSKKNGDINIIQFEKFKKNEDENFTNYCLKQNKLLNDLNNLRNKLDNLYNLILNDENDEEQNFINFKKINQINSLDKILEHNKICDKEPNKKELILLLDDNKNIWELSLEKDMTEDKLKSGKIKINNNKEESLNNNEEIDIEISMNSSFIEEEEGENDLNNKFDISLKVNLNENFSENEELSK